MDKELDRYIKLLEVVVDKDSEIIDELVEFIQHADFGWNSSDKAKQLLNKYGVSK